MIIRKVNDNKYLFQCPDCKGHGYIDKEQAEGKISIFCNHWPCKYHETKDWLNEAKEYL